MAKAHQPVHGVATDARALTVRVRVGPRPCVWRTVVPQGGGRRARAAELRATHRMGLLLVDGQRGEDGQPPLGRRVGKEVQGQAACVAPHAPVVRIVSRSARPCCQNQRTRLAVALFFRGFAAGVSAAAVY